MRFETKEGVTHIYSENGHSDQEVLRAIVKASFDLARPAGLGFMQFNKDQPPLTDEQADGFIRVGEGCVVHMDYVQGRQCKTIIFKEAEAGHFTLNNRAFERDRGNPNPMLERARAILADKAPEEDGLASTSHMYKGENLDKRLHQFGLTRNPGEKDWAFRKRIFPDLFATDRNLAAEFLLGASRAEWNNMDQILFADLLSRTRGEANRQKLVKFAKGYTDDPIKLRERAMAASAN